MSNLLCYAHPGIMENIIHNSRRGRSADGSPASFYNRCPAAAMQSAAEADAQRSAGVPPASSGSVQLPVPLAFSLVFQNWLTCPQSVRPRSITRSNCSQNPQRLVRVNPGKSGQKNSFILRISRFKFASKASPVKVSQAQSRLTAINCFARPKPTQKTPRKLQKNR